jgi:ABC-type polysaccharide/polyol phosphate transport system ATPase subunit
MDPAIEAQELSLVYRLTHQPIGSFKELAIGRARGRIRYQELWALRDVSFTLRPGQVLGVIGPNGAGKSTLLKVISRVLAPTGGRVVVRGNLAPMLELGAGFVPGLTAAENIVLYGALLGREPRAMRARVLPILEWAGLTEYLDVAVRAFSSGMVARLAFAVATDTRPDVLLLDELLAVGDEAFRARALQRMETLIGGGAAVVLVSHALPLVRSRASSVLWLDGGRTVELGDPDEVIDRYLRTEAAPIGTPS